MQMNIETMRTIDEIVARYQLEPDLRDVFVEGDSDKRILEWYCGQERMRGVSVYCISTVQIPEGKITGKLTSGNKTRVIQLSDILAGKLSAEIDNVRFLVDRDAETLYGDEITNRLLLRTDYSCIESYFFDWSGFTKVMGLYFNLQLTRDVFESFGSSLKALFIFRAAKRVVSPELPMQKKWTAVLRITAGKMEFDVAEYLNRFLTMRGMGEVATGIHSEVLRLRNIASNEIRYYLHGHDYISLLCWYARECGVANKICDTDLVHRAIYVSAEHEHFREYPLFVELRSWSGVRVS